ncbi:LysR substrate-binding domain-containing protein [Lichenihabitans psoromatis]|uniref:LysR substrate-binding domain-containing protein n=1 Tax=Lichenihabitans psoromatis TaxID=2528642 RepID=UPI0013F15F37|nr:LysR substrate-binding domain-containing protein [Lichenihabitans psoromatis]
MKLPPLYPLRSFEATARCKSFTAAAAELKITQSAVSHQVRSLETYFGVTLFHRTSVGPVLTAEGKRLFEVATSAFEALSEINHRLPDSQMDGTIILSVPPIFYTWWLLPRLMTFNTQFPHVRFQLLHGMRMSRAAQNEVDVAFHWGDKIPFGFDGRKLVAERKIAVCSPLIAAGLKPREDPRSLEHATLLHEIDYSGWEAWMRAAGLELSPMQKSWVFDDPGIMLETAIQGQGVTLAPAILLRKLLATGKLVQLFDHAAPSNLCYFCCTPQRGAQKRAARIFHEWVLQTATND